MTDSKKINPFVFAHRDVKGHWHLQDHHRGEKSLEIYATFEAARIAYQNGETTWKE